MFIPRNAQSYKIYRRAWCQWCCKFDEKKHMFKLQSKDSSADRMVPAMPLAFYKPGFTTKSKVTRYNLRKFSELPFQLVRCYRYKDLYDHVLLNYKVIFVSL